MINFPSLLLETSRSCFEKATKLKPQPFSMDMGFIWGLLGEGKWGARTGRLMGEGLLLALKCSACCLEVRMCENSCRSERREKKIIKWTLSLGKEARTRI